MEICYDGGSSSITRIALKPSLVEWKLANPIPRGPVEVTLKPSLVEWKCAMQNVKPGAIRGLETFLGGMEIAVGNGMSATSPDP